MLLSNLYHVNNISQGNLVLSLLDCHFRLIEGYIISFKWKSAIIVYLIGFLIEHVLSYRHLLACSIYSNKLRGNYFASEFCAALIRGQCLLLWGGQRKFLVFTTALRPTTSRLVSGEWPSLSHHCRAASLLSDVA